PSRRGPHVGTSVDVEGPSLVSPWTALRFGICRTGSGAVRPDALPSLSAGVWITGSRAVDLHQPGELADRNWRTCEVNTLGCSKLLTCPAAAMTRSSAL